MERLYVVGRNDKKPRRVQHIPTFVGERTHKGRYYLMLLHHEQGPRCQLIHKKRIIKAED